MRPTTRTPLPATALATLALLWTAHAALADGLSIRKLPFDPIDVNSAAQVLGLDSIWTYSGESELALELEHADDPCSFGSTRAVDISERGIVLGSLGFQDADFRCHAGFFLYDAGGEPFRPGRRLSTEPGVVLEPRVALRYEPVAVNDGGDFVTHERRTEAIGGAYDVEQRVLVFTGGDPIELSEPVRCTDRRPPQLDCPSAAFAMDINAGGQVVGYQKVGAGTRAMLWGAAKLSNVLPYGNGRALAINDSGQVLVEAGGALYLVEDGASVPIGEVRARPANSLNNAGQVVGSASGRAVLWDNGRLYDLNRWVPPGSGWTLYEAVAISDNGLIVGRGNQGGFLLEPQDSDGDGVDDLHDNCPHAPNPEQRDHDGDGQGDACDPCTDSDADDAGDPGFETNFCPEDNCPFHFNPSQQDRDHDGSGDACDACPLDRDNDLDEDGRCGNEDLCAEDHDPLQKDTDGDGLGDACDPDDDNDGIPDDGDGSLWIGDRPCTGGDTAFCDDNCQFVVNPSQTDGNGNGRGTACEAGCSAVVGPSGFPDPEFRTIDEALTWPELRDGCRFRVKPGVYSGGLVIDSNVVLIAEGGAALTEINAGERGTAILIAPRDGPGRTAIRGFTIRGGSVGVDAEASIDLTNSVVAPASGTAVRLGPGSHRLENVTIHSAETGIEVLRSGRATISRTRVGGTAIAGIEVSGTVVLDNGLVADNPGTGVRVAAGGRLRMTFSTVTCNGTGLASESTALTVRHSIVHGNTVDVAGAACSRFRCSDVGIDCAGEDGNVSVDPGFMDPACPGDYHLAPDSPVIDYFAEEEEESCVIPAGSGRAPCNDLDGQPRLLDAYGIGEPYPDLGADEFAPPESSSREVRRLVWAAGDKSRLRWTGGRRGELYHVYSGELYHLGYRDLWGHCLATTSRRDFVDTETPRPGQGFFYLVTRESHGGEEKSLGWATCHERPNGFPCY